MLLNLDTVFKFYKVWIQLFYNRIKFEISHVFGKWIIINEILISYFILLFKSVISGRDVIGGVSQERESFVGKGKVS